MPAGGGTVVPMVEDAVSGLANSLKKIDGDGNAINNFKPTNAENGNRY